jgi:GTP-binding protein
MKRIPVEFLRVAASPTHYPPAGLPEVAFAGRSNVGKSSLINAILDTANMARVSRIPGRTKQLVFFRVDERFIFVDLPGYGFARVSDKMLKQWKTLVEAYMTGRRTLGLVVVVLDIRRDVSADDLALFDWLFLQGIPTLPVLTKIDKLAAGEVSIRKAKIRGQIGLPAEAPLILFSARTREGRKLLWREIQRLGKACGNDSGNVKQKA